MEIEKCKTCEYSEIEDDNIKCLYDMESTPYPTKCPFETFKQRREMLLCWAADEAHDSGGSSIYCAVILRLQNEIEATKTITELRALLSSKNIHKIIDFEEVYSNICED